MRKIGITFLLRTLNEHFSKGWEWWYLPGDCGEFLLKRCTEFLYALKNWPIDAHRCTDFFEIGAIAVLFHGQQGTEQERLHGWTFHTCSCQAMKLAEIAHDLQAFQHPVEDVLPLPRQLEFFCGCGKQHCLEFGPREQLFVGNIL